MLRILEAHRSEEAHLNGLPAGHDDNDDRGSGVGSCMFMEGLSDIKPASGNRPCSESVCLDDDMDLGSNILS